MTIRADAMQQRLHPDPDAHGPGHHGVPVEADVAIVGAGAAGLFSAIWAAQAARDSGHRLRVVAVDGAARIGAKILVAGGGRCNVTHHAVRESDYSGSTSGAIRSVLRRFDVARTVAWFAAHGVTLKREDTGKLFPTTDDAHTVLDALLSALHDAGAVLVHPWRVESVTRDAGGFVVRSPSGELRASRLVMATGGRSLPRSGSDGAGLDIARALGHTTTDLIVPALVPLTLPDGHWIRSLSGLTLEAELTLRSGSTRKLRSIRGSTLCTHFGISGPSVLDMSRHWHHARAEDGSCTLECSWRPGTDADSIDAQLVALKGTGVGAWLRDLVPERLARALCAAADVPHEATPQQLPRERRRALVRLLCATPLPVTGDRGWNAAEVTAGGVPLDEVDVRTMESRLVPGLHLAGEICDVDGRIGGFNFQWAWASGFVAGVSAAASAAGAQH